MTKIIKTGDIKHNRDRLLAWYDKNGRVLPWRETKDPYHVWLSEIMLQQTTVPAVIPYFLKFLKKWPTIQSLAKTDVHDVMKEWAGLGYYARARNLHACAKIVAYKLNGIFPKTEKGLKELPGIGDYTAAAILTIVYNIPATVMDANIDRVMARFFVMKEPLPAGKKKLKEQTSQFFDKTNKRPGDTAQAMMDLGAAICIVGKPKCAICPLQKDCLAKKLDIAETLPLKAAKTKRPQRTGDVYWITDSRGRVLIHRRPNKGLLGGMAGLPTSSWADKAKKPEVPAFISKRLPKSKTLNMTVEHTFTHFDLILGLKTLSVSNVKEEGYFWVDSKNIHSVGLPTVFAKAMKIFNKA